MSADCAVVIPLYNGARWILQTLDSVLAQTQAPAEVVVVDDGSTDDSPSIVEALGRGVLLVRGEKRGGPPAARNLGLGRTRSPLVAFVDQDDPWHPRHLELLAGALRRNPEAPAAVGGFEPFHDGTEPAYSIVECPDAVLDPWEGFPLLNSIHCPSCVLVRRTALDALGSWEPRFTGVADLHLWLRLSIRHPFVHVPSVTVGRRLHHTSNLQALVSSDPVRFLRLRREAVEEALGHRLTSVGDAGERERLSHRFFIAGVAVDLARSYVESDRAGFARAALESERILAGEGETLRRGLFVLLTYSVCPSGSSLEGREKLARFLTVVPLWWPREAPMTRASLLRYVGSPKSDPPVSPWRGTSPQ